VCRCLAVHPTQPYILSGSDDMLIKLWNWEEVQTCHSPELMLMFRIAWQRRHSRVRRHANALTSWVQLSCWTQSAGSCCGELPRTEDEWLPSA